MVLTRDTLIINFLHNENLLDNAKLKRSQLILFNVITIIIITHLIQVIIYQGLYYTHINIDTIYLTIGYAKQTGSCIDFTIKR